MSVQFPKPSGRIEQIETAQLTAVRPRQAGSNARLGVHGTSFTMPIVKLVAGGQAGYGWARLEQQQAQALLGKNLADMVDENGWLKQEYACIEFPYMDWLGMGAGKSVHALLQGGSAPNGFKMACYDTSLYFDDLHLADDKEAVALLQQEAQEGLDKGHRAFKIKVGRGGMHMPLQQGMERDIQIVHGVRQTVGPDCHVMVDVNNGYNLNLTKTFLQETKAANLYWLEEAFHEDDRLYENLRGWMRQEGIGTLIADGEGLASPELVAWAEKGLIDIVQYDLRDYGFFKWLALGPKLDAHSLYSAPHNYGSCYGNYATGHLQPAIQKLAMVEWDEAPAEGMDDSAYSIQDGHVVMSDVPGFGLGFDAAWFEKMAKENGYIVK